MVVRLTTLLILTVFGLVCACTSAQREETEWTGEIPREQYIYEVKCTRCHEYYDPADYRQKTMRHYFKKYAAKSGIKRADRPAVLQWALDQCRDAPLANDGN